MCDLALVCKHCSVVAHFLIIFLSALHTDLQPRNGRRIRYSEGIIPSGMLETDNGIQGSASGKCAPTSAPTEVMLCASLNYISWQRSRLTCRLQVPTAVPTTIEQACVSRWTYSNPESWCDACITGRRQSPVNILKSQYLRNRTVLLTKVPIQAQFLSNRFLISSWSDNDQLIRFKVESSSLGTEGAGTGTAFTDVTSPIHLKTLADL